MVGSLNRFLIQIVAGTNYFLPRIPSAERIADFVDGMVWACEVRSGTTWAGGIRFSLMHDKVQPGGQYDGWGKLTSER